MVFDSKKVSKLWEKFKELVENPFGFERFIQFYNWIRYIYSTYFEPYGVDFEDVDWLSILNPFLTSSENERKIEDMFKTGEIYRYVTIEPEKFREEALERTAERFAERFAEIFNLEEKEKKKKKRKPSEEELTLMEEISEIKSMIKEIINILKKRGFREEIIFPEERLEIPAVEQVSKLDVIMLMKSIIDHLIDLEVIENKGFLKKILDDVIGLVEKNWNFIAPLLIKPIGIVERPKKIPRLETPKKQELLEKVIRELSELEEIFSRDYKRYKDIIEIYNTFDQVHKTFIYLIKVELNRKLHVVW